VSGWRGEEDIGIWKYNAEPTADPADPLTNGVMIDGTGPGGHLIADVEGLAIAKTGAGTGFLIAANQGNSTYAVYTREGSNAYLKTFQIGSGPACIDEVTGSDGIEVTTAPLRPVFPAGVFVSQDDSNGPSGNQNFKLVPL
jgi:myo-inositol-hexaphosphate 3-phosphohydrolase